MNKFVFLDRATLAPNIEFPSLAVEHQWEMFPNTLPHQVVQRCQGAQAVITNKVVIDKDVIRQLPQLRYVGVAATGVNVVDLQACAEAGITVCNVEHYGSDSVAEHVLMLMLMLVRQMKAYQKALANGEWQRREQFCFFLEPVNTLRGLTLGLVGTGNIAHAVARLARSFGMHVVFHSPSGRKKTEGEACISFAALLADSDVLSIHTPLTQCTHHLVDEAALAQMNANALLINTARGAVVDTTALLTALQNKTIAGAALDVLPAEPPAKDDPLFCASLQMDNLLLTPHIAWTSQSAMATLVSQLCERLDTFFSGGDVPNLAAGGN